MASLRTLPFKPHRRGEVRPQHQQHDVAALQELQRVSNGRAFVQVDSYRTPEQKAVFEDWVLTAKFHDYPDGWLKLFEEAGYTGDYYWTIIE